MRALFDTMLSRSAVKRRRREVEQRLTSYGLGPSSAEPSPCPRMVTEKTTQGQSLCNALQTLGPVFACFGMYLSSRADLLPAEKCLELAALSDQVEAMPIATVCKRIHCEMGCPPREVYLDFEERPFASRLLYQAHRAVLYSGEPVTVKLLRPELGDLIRCDVELLPLVQLAFARQEWRELRIEEVVDDFVWSLQKDTEFGPQAEALATLNHGRNNQEMLQVPRVYPALCSSKILTFERFPAPSLQDAIASRNSCEPTQGQGTPLEDPGMDRTALARLLCFAWLGQVFQGRLFPVEPRLDNIAILPDQKLAFTGSVFTSLPSDASADLWDYLIAALTRDPDEACSCLLREMENDRGLAGEHELRRGFRQAVPFRDGCWNGSGGDSVAESLFVHWKLARRLRYRPRPCLLAFYRSLFLIAAVARRLAPGEDPLREGLEERCMMSLFDQFRELMGVQRWSDNLEKYATAFSELPTRLDQALKIGADGDAPLNLQAIGTAGQGHRRNHSLLVAGLLLFLAGVVLSFPGPAPLMGARISAVVFVLCGAWLLLASGRPR